MGKLLNCILNCYVVWYINMNEIVAVGAASAAGVAGTIVADLFFGGFNPNYSKEDRRRMRYIQLKYAQAYCTGETGEPNTIISDIDGNSKLKMNLEGFKPANPFPDERAFEESLVVNYHPTSGHQGKFCASHAMVSIGAIVEYQIQRKNRLWVPGVSSAGRPNDYINMFLEEMKCWMKTQMTLDSVAADELRKRHVYIMKLKNDKYFWCFPPEHVNDAKIHSVIDLVHSRVMDALEVTEREEANKSMAHLFKDLNDHSTNAFEFGKSFLAYLLYVTKPAPHDLVSSITNGPANGARGKTVEAGRLHRIVEKATAPVMRMYVQDMKSQQNRLSIGNDAVDRGDVATTVVNSTEAFTCYKVLSVTHEPTTFSMNTVYMVSLYNPTGSGSGGNSSGDTDTDSKGTQRDTGTTLGTHWILRKTYSDFATLWKAISDDYAHNEVMLVALPDRFGSLQVVSRTDQEERCDGLKRSLQSALLGMSQDASLSRKSRDVLAEFVDVKTLPEVVASGLSVHAESIPNHFVDMKRSFLRHIGNCNNNSGNNSSGTGANTLSNNGKSDSKCNPTSCDNSDNGTYDLTPELDVCRETWGHEGVLSILNAYAQLQRMATVLGWTLEINHFFVSMFGNTLAFCKLPIRELLMTQKDVMLAFQRTAVGLYDYACKLNAQKNYKWHANLQVTEASLVRCRHHIDQAVATIGRLETEHLDREAQLRRLRDVAARFEPFMRRIDGSLPQIQRELGLPLHLVNHSGANGDEDYDNRVASGSDGSIGSGADNVLFNPAAPPHPQHQGVLHGQHALMLTGNIPPPPGGDNDHRFEIIDDDDVDDCDADAAVAVDSSGCSGTINGVSTAGPIMQLNERAEVQTVDNNTTQTSEVCIVM